MELSNFDRFFWIAGFIGHIVLLTMLVSKRNARQFPMFTALIAFLIAKGGALYCLRKFGITIYFYSYWSLALVATLLELLVFFEVVRKVFQPSGNLSKDIRRPLVILITASGCFAAFIAVLAAFPVKQIEQSLIIRGELFATTIFSELFAGLLLLSLTAGFSLRTHVGVIVRGFGVFSTLSLISQGVNSYYGTNNDLQLYKLFSHIQIGIYFACLCYWIFGFARTLPETKPLPAHMRLQLSRLNMHAASTLSELRLRKETL